MKNREPRLIDGTMAMTHEEILEVLKDGEYGIISTIGEDGYPYGFPMSYITMDEHIYFHCALDGHKLDNIKYNSKVSFCVVGETKLIPEDLDTGYKSVIVFGNAKEVQGEEKVRALIQIVKKYCEGFEHKGKFEAERDKDITTVLKISIDYATGKIRRM